MENNLQIIKVTGNRKTVITPMSGNPDSPYLSISHFRKVSKGPRGRREWQNSGGADYIDSTSEIMQKLQEISTRQGA